MNDQLWEDMQIDDEKRGWFAMPPPEITAEFEFIGHTKCIYCELMELMGDDCDCEDGIMEVWLELEVDDNDESRRLF